MTMGTGRAFRNSVDKGDKFDYNTEIIACFVSEVFLSFVLKISAILFDRCFIYKKDVIESKVASLFNHL